MALIKKIKTEFGIDAEYFIINKINIDRELQLLSLQILGYISEEQRKNNAKPIIQKILTIPIDRVKQSLIAPFYNLLQNSDLSFLKDNSLPDISVENMPLFNFTEIDLPVTKAINAIANTEGI